jgi:hypothetical protein
MRGLIALLLLAGCATAAGPGGYPSRATVAAVTLRMMSCNDPSGYMHCPPPPSRIEVRSLACRPDPREGDPGRIFCRFAGTRWWPARQAFGPVCTSFRYDPDERLWLILLFPTFERCADPDG